MYRLMSGKFVSQRSVDVHFASLVFAIYRLLLMKCSRLCDFGIPEHSALTWLKGKCKEESRFDLCHVLDLPPLWNNR